MNSHLEPNTSVGKTIESTQLSNRYVYGLKGLRSILGCAHNTAHRIKASGKIPYFQSGKKIIFDVDAVLQALSSTNKKKNV